MPSDEPGFIAHRTSIDLKPYYLAGGELLFEALREASDPDDDAPQSWEDCTEDEQAALVGVAAYVLARIVPKVVVQAVTEFEESATGEEVVYVLDVESEQ